MRIQCGIFDFDGTLFDSMYIWDTVGEVYLRSRGREPAPGLAQVVQAMSLDQSARYFQREYGLDLPVGEIVAGINRVVERFYTREVQPKPGVRAFLQALEKTGVSLCIATATDRPLIEAALARCGMGGYFRAIFTCGEVGHGKDEPVIFRRAMGFFGANREHTIVFEDALHAARTAKEDGFALAAVHDSSEPRQRELRALADCYIPDFAHTEEFWNFASGESMGTVPV